MIGISAAGMYLASVHCPFSATYFMPPCMPHMPRVPMNQPDACMHQDTGMTHRTYTVCGHPAAAAIALLHGLGTVLAP